MKAYILISIAIISFYSTECNAQWWGSVSGLNPPLLHQLVGNSKTEHEKQTNAKNEQAKSTGIEEGHKISLNSFEYEHILLLKKR